MFKDLISGIWGQIKRGDFDFWELIIPVFIEGAKGIAQKLINGEELNSTWIAVVKYAYYGTFLFYDELVKNPDEQWTDEAIEAARDVFLEAAFEGGFELDIPDDQE